jgi:hypothetical protein
VIRSCGKDAEPVTEQQSPMPPSPPSVGASRGSRWGSKDQPSCPSEWMCMGDASFATHLALDLPNSLGGPVGRAPSRHRFASAQGIRDVAHAIHIVTGIVTDLSTRIPPCRRKDVCPTATQDDWRKRSRCLVPVHFGFRSGAHPSGRAAPHHQHGKERMVAPSNPEPLLSRSSGDRG